MSFNKRSRLDPSQVEDRRGRRGGGTAIAVGGGGLGLIITIVAIAAGREILLARQLVIPGKCHFLLRALAESTTWRRNARQGQTRITARIAASWASSTASNLFGPMNLPSRGSQYTPADTVLFTGSTEAACGYCQQRNGAILLSGRPESLSGPRLLQ